MKIKLNKIRTKLTRIGFFLPNLSPTNHTKTGAKRPTNKEKDKILPTIDCSKPISTPNLSLKAHIPPAGNEKNRRPKVIRTTIGEFSEILIFTSDSSIDKDCFLAKNKRGDNNKNINPKVYGTSRKNFDEDIKRVRRDKYYMIGGAFFTGTSNSADDPKKAAIEKDADIVLYYKEYLNTTTSNTSMSVPDTQTSTHSGSVYSSGL